LKNFLSVVGDGVDEGTKEPEVLNFSNRAQVNVTTSLVALNLNPSFHLF